MTHIRVMTTKKGRGNAGN